MKNPVEPQKELSAEEKLRAEVESLKKELADEKEKYLRLDAEYYNYRTRSIKEKQEAYDNALFDTSSISGSAIFSTSLSSRIYMSLRSLFPERSSAAVFAAIHLS